MSDSEKHSTLRLVVAVFVSLLTSGTVALFTRSSLLQATRWGWLILFFYLTWEVIYSDSGKKWALKFRRLYGGIPAMSYILVPLCFAALGLIYWIGINKVYNLFNEETGRQDAAVTQAAPTPALSVTPTPRPFPAPPASPSHTPKPVPPPTPENATIQSMRIETRLTCELRPNAEIPPAEVEFGPWFGGNLHMKGAAGDVEFTLTSPVRFRRQGQNQIVVINQFALPNGSDIQGRPVTSLQNYDVIESPVTMIVYGKSLQSATLFELSMSINGRDIWYYSYPIHSPMVQDEQGHTLLFRVLLTDLKKKTRDF